MSNIILGLNAYHADASAAIVVDGKLIAAAAEERFNRIKHCAGFPDQAVRYCLKAADLRLSQIDAITTSKDPSAHRLKKAFYALRNPALLTPKFLTSRLRQASRITDIRQEVAAAVAERSDDLPELVPVEHHTSHGASAF